MFLFDHSRFGSIFHECTSLFSPASPPVCCLHAFSRCAHSRMTPPVCVHPLILLVKRNRAFILNGDRPQLAFGWDLIVCSSASSLRPMLSPPTNFPWGCVGGQLKQRFIITFTSSNELKRLDPGLLMDTHIIHCPFSTVLASVLNGARRWMGRGLLCVSRLFC